MEKYPQNGAYVFCNANPIRFIDEDGRDWFEATDNSENSTYFWDESEKLWLINNQGTFRNVGKNVVVFDGSREECPGTKDGTGKYIDGDGAINAIVSVYGSNGSDDVNTYTGYTMTSDPDKYVPIAEGEFRGSYVDPGKKGLLPSNWRLDGNIPTMDNLPNTNPYSVNDWNYNQPIKTGIYIHSTGKNGNLGSRNSTGCLLILDSDWSSFKTNMEGVENFNVIIKR